MTPGEIMGTDRKPADGHLPKTNGQLQSSNGHLPTSKDLEKSVVEPDSTTDVPTLTKDGMRLHPQPTSDPLDPLNWTTGKKHSILAIVMALYFVSELRHSMQSIQLIVRYCNA